MKRALPFLYHYASLLNFYIKNNPQYQIKYIFTIYLCDFTTETGLKCTKENKLS
jgi:hypothetical protein